MVAELDAIAKWRKGRLMFDNTLESRNFMKGDVLWLNKLEGHGFGSAQFRITKAATVFFDLIQFDRNWIYIKKCRRRYAALSTLILSDYRRGRSLRLTGVPKLERVTCGASERGGGRAAKTGLLCREHWREVTWRRIRALNLIRQNWPDVVIHRSAVYSLDGNSRYVYCDKGYKALRLPNEWFTLLARIPESVSQ